MKNLKLLVMVLILASSCQKDDETFEIENTNCDDCNITITKDESRLEVMNNVVTLGRQSTASSKVYNEPLELVLKAIVDPIVVDYQGEDVMLNANHLSVRNRRVAASYSIVGEPYGGAIDIIDIPNGGDPSLDGTLLTPDKDIDYVFWNSRKKLMFGGGLNVDAYPEAAASSNFEYYNVSDNSNDLTISKIKEYNQPFGNKLNHISKINGRIVGSGGGINGNAFVYQINANVIHEDNSGVMAGLYVLDICQTRINGAKKMATLAYDSTSQELKVFYFHVTPTSLDYLYNVSLGNWDLNVEAKHSIYSPKEGVIMVSLEQEGLGVFEVTDSNGVTTANLTQQFKSEILDPANPDEVVNSFSFSNNTLWVAAGAAGVLIMPFDQSTETLEYAYNMEVPGESVNSILKNGDNLVVGSSSGVRIYDTN